MDFQSYIVSAKSVIRAVPAYARGNKFYLRNRIAEISLYLAEKDPENWREFFSYSKVDIAECQDRANHYGVNIGDPIGKRRQMRRDDYFDQCAKHLKIIKNSIKIFAMNEVL